MSQSSKTKLQNLQSQLEHLNKEDSNNINTKTITGCYLALEQSIKNIHTSLLSEEEFRLLGSCCIEYIDCVSIFATKSTHVKYQTKNATIQGFLSILTTIAELLGDLRTDFVEFMAIPIFTRVGNLRTSWFSKILLETFKVHLQNTIRKRRYKIFMENVTTFFKLIDVICYCGDYTYQATLIEIIFRMCSPQQIKEYASEFFPESKELQNALTSVELSNFDFHLRVLQNCINRKYRTIFSVECTSIVLDDIIVTAPEGLDTWVDFNIGCKSISFYCDKNCLIKNNINYTEEDEDNWETVTVMVDGISSVTSSNFAPQEKHVIIGKIIRFHLKEPCICKFLSSYQARNVFIITVLEGNELQELEKNILPQMFGNEYVPTRKAEYFKQSGLSITPDVCLPGAKQLKPMLSVLSTAESPLGSSNVRMYNGNRNCDVNSSISRVSFEGTALTSPSHSSSIFSDDSDLDKSLNKSLNNSFKVATKTYSNKQPKKRSVISSMSFQCSSIRESEEFDYESPDKRYDVMQISNNSDNSPLNDTTEMNFTDFEKEKTDRSQKTNQKYMLERLIGEVQKNVGQCDSNLEIVEKKTPEEKNNGDVTEVDVIRPKIFNSASSLYSSVSSAVKYNNEGERNETLFANTLCAAETPKEAEEKLVENVKKNKQNSQKGTEIVGNENSEYFTCSEDLEAGKTIKQKDGVQSEETNLKIENGKRKINRKGKENTKPCDSTKFKTNKRRFKRSLSLEEKAFGFHECGSNLNQDELDEVDIFMRKIEELKRQEIEGAFQNKSNTRRISIITSEKFESENRLDEEHGSKKKTFGSEFPYQEKEVEEKAKGSTYQRKEDQKEHASMEFSTKEEDLEITVPKPPKNRKENVEKMQSNVKDLKSNADSLRQQEPDSTEFQLSEEMVDQNSKISILEVEAEKTLVGINNGTENSNSIFNELPIKELNTSALNRSSATSPVITMGKFEKISSSQNKFRRNQTTISNTNDIIQNKENLNSSFNKLMSHLQDGKEETGKKGKSNVAKEKPTSSLKKTERISKLIVQEQDTFHEDQKISKLIVQEQDIFHEDQNDESLSKQEHEKTINLNSTRHLNKSIKPKSKRSRINVKYTAKSISDQNMEHVKDSLKDQMKKAQNDLENDSKYNRLLSLIRPCCIEVKQENLVEKMNFIKNNKKKSKTDEALITDEALVTNEALVTDEALVTAEALITDEALVTDEGLVTDEALITDGKSSQHEIEKMDPTNVKIPLKDKKLQKEPTEDSKTYTLKKKTFAKIVKNDVIVGRTETLESSTRLLIDDSSLIEKVDQPIESQSKKSKSFVNDKVKADFAIRNVSQVNGNVDHINPQKTFTYDPFQEATTIAQSRPQSRKHKCPKDDQESIQRPQINIISNLTIVPEKVNSDLQRTKKKRKLCNTDDLSYFEQSYLQEQNITPPISNSIRIENIPPVQDPRNLLQIAEENDNSKVYNITEIEKSLQTERRSFLQELNHKKAFDEFMTELLTNRPSATLDPLYWCKPKRPKKHPARQLKIDAEKSKKPKSKVKKILEEHNYTKTTKKKKRYTDTSLEDEDNNINIQDTKDLMKMQRINRRAAKLKETKSRNGLEQTYKRKKENLRRNVTDTSLEDEEVTGVADNNNNIEDTKDLMKMQRSNRRAAKLKETKSRNDLDLTHQSLEDLTYVETKDLNSDEKNKKVSKKFIDKEQIYAWIAADTSLDKESIFETIEPVLKSVLNISNETLDVMKGSIPANRKPLYDSLYMLSENLNNYFNNINCDTSLDNLEFIDNI